MLNTLLIRYVLTAALRDRLILSFALILVVATSLSLFMGSAAVVEQGQFSLVFTGGALRIVLNLASVLFVVFHMRRSFETKDVDFLLSRPIGRLSYIASHAAAFSFLAVVFSVLAGGVLLAIGGGVLSEGRVLWLVSVMAETIIMVNLALFFSMVVSSAVGGALACFGFYILGRMMGQLLGIIDAQGAAWAYILQYPLQMVSALMPRLDLMGQTSWLVYGVGEGIGLGYVLVQAGIFVLLVLSASLIDLIRRQF